MVGRGEDGEEPMRVDMMENNSLDDEAWMMRSWKYSVLAARIVITSSFFSL
jgi:hypothetical protein